MWQVKLSNKAKHFLWRVCHDTLTVQETLNMHGIRVVDGCWVCGNAEESARHVLRDCPFARLVWCVSGLISEGIGRGNKSVMEWWRERYEVLTAEEFDLMLTICW